MAMADLLPQRNGLALAIERYGPLAVSAACVAACYFATPTLIERFSEKGGWEISNLYNAVFNWSAIQTGFAFGVFGFVVGKSDGFIAEIRETVAMRRFMGYVRRANIGGFALTISSLPLTVMNPGLDRGPWFYPLLVWLGLFVWTFLAFLRIAYNFGRLSSVRDRPEFYGA